MNTLYFLLFLAAVILFFLAAVMVKHRKFNLVAAGLFFCALVWAIQAFRSLK